MCTHAKTLAVVTVNAVLALAWPIAPSAQAPAWLRPTARVGVHVSIEPTGTGRPHEVVLVVEVTPASGIHVYAPGNKDYIPVEVAIDPAQGLAPGTAVYPPSEPLVFGELRQLVQVYQKPFRIRQPVRVDSSARGRPLTITGSLRYQACTNTVCYRPESQPFSILVPASASSSRPRT